jgi:hypothetical protein
MEQVGQILPATIKTARRLMASFGIQTAALGFGGQSTRCCSS